MICDFYRKTAELGGNLRTGLEDTFYLTTCERAKTNCELIESMTKVAGQVGRIIASPAEIREIEQGVHACANS